MASARHSMGASRISCVLLDLKVHSAATTLEVSGQDGNFTVSQKGLADGNLFDEWKDLI